MLKKNIHKKDNKYYIFRNKLISEYKETQHGGMNLYETDECLS